MKKSIILLLIIIGLTAIGYFVNLYDWKTSIILITAIILGGYVGGKLLSKKSS